MSKIEWTGKTWNPIRGCSRVGTECRECYAMKLARRSDRPDGAYEGLTTTRNGKVDWSGQVRFEPRLLDAPMRVRKPTTWFVNSMGDLFHKSLTNEEIAATLGVMAACPQHTFQILTKRSKRMRDWSRWVTSLECDPWTECHAEALHRDGDSEYIHRHSGGIDGRPWPLPNVWLGVSCGVRDTLFRLDDLRNTPAAVRFVSFEPLLEDLGRIDLHAIDWAIVGAESGHGARPMHEDWVRSIRDQCEAAGTRFFYKQSLDQRGRKVSLPVLDGRQWSEMPGEAR